MQFVVVTGLSGAGKSYAMNVLEDIGFYCIDNMPPKLITKFGEICLNSEEKYSKVAIAVDIRAGDMFDEIVKSYKELENMNINVKILYLEATNEVIIKRYKETRRKHPLDLQFNSCLSKAVTYEREQLNELREMADYYLDTSYLSNSQLKEQIVNIFLKNKSDSMMVKVMSFGFKYGSTAEADLIFDVRCLPNPYYIPDLKEHTGKESCVQNYVMSFEQSKQLFNKISDLIDFLIPLYIQEGKSQLVIGFGCTGGKHRSATFTELLSKHLIEKGMKVIITHRDIEK
ncbi:MAG: RNase adapter RapZ [Oscillospiraceae bacterium]